MQYNFTYQLRIRFLFKGKPKYSDNSRVEFTQQIQTMLLLLKRKQVRQYNQIEGL